MRAENGRGDEQRGSTPKTLGDILYSDTGKSRTSEKHWAELVRAIAAGDQVALHAIYQQTHRLVYTLIFRITNNRETAEELTVDVFYDVWRRAASYDSAGGSVVGWIMNQARSRAIDRLRYDQRKKRVNSTDEHPLPPFSPPDPQSACDSAEQSRALENALKDLTSEEKQVIEIAFFSEMTYREVAEQLNEPLGTVKTRIRSGLAKLRSNLSRRLKIV